MHISKSRCVKEAFSILLAVNAIYLPGDLLGLATHQTISNQSTTLFIRLMVQKSSDHQSRLVGFISLFTGFHTCSGVVFFSRISEPSIFLVFKDDPFLVGLGPPSPLPYPCSHLRGQRTLDQVLMPNDSVTPNTAGPTSLNSVSTTVGSGLRSGSIAVRDFSDSDGRNVG